jgi:hypothetical protein
MNSGFSPLSAEISGQLTAYAVRCLLPAKRIAQKRDLYKTDPSLIIILSEPLFSEACPAAAKEQVSWLAASGAFLRFFLLRTSNLHTLFARLLT